MIEFCKIRIHEFKKTITQRFGGWKVYWGLYLQALKNLKKLPLRKKEKNKTKFILFLQFLFKPFKQFYHYVSLLEGKIKITKNDWKPSDDFEFIDCTVKTKYYLFGVFVFSSKRPINKKEMEELRVEYENK